MGGKRLTDKLNINKRRWRGGGKGSPNKGGGSENCSRSKVITCYH